MKGIKFQFLLSSLFSLFTFPTVAADYDKGMKCYEEQDYACSLEVWAPLADHGDARAQDELGWMYYKGIGVTKDYTEALKWFQKAANQGLATAEYHLGFMYQDGRAVTKDFAEAVKWYQKAAHQGDASAQNNLGMMYAHGRGLDKNYARAVYWLAKAAQQGDSGAIWNLDSTGARERLTLLTVNRPSINIREKAETTSPIVAKASQGDTLYQLSNENGWYEVYVSSGHILGFVSELLVTVNNKSNQKQSSNDPYPERPAPRAGHTTCNTSCTNGSCYRTYSDGKKIHFQAPQKWNPFTNQFEWDSGGC